MASFGKGKIEAYVRPKELRAADDLEKRARELRLGDERNEMEEGFASGAEHRSPLRVQVARLGTAQLLVGVREKMSCDGQFS